MQYNESVRYKLDTGRDARLKFVNWYLQRMYDVEIYCTHVLFTDKVWFRLK